MRNCTTCVAKPMALISFAVTTKLIVTAKTICAFVFAYAKCWFSLFEAHLFTYQSTFKDRYILISHLLVANERPTPGNNHDQGYSRRRGYETIFIVNSAESKIYPAHKC